MKPWLMVVLVAGLFMLPEGHATALHGHRWTMFHSATGNADQEGAWSVERQNGRGLWASTKGDQGALGQFCSEDGACAWLIVLWNATCAEGEQHPVLVNTDRAASHHVLQCIGTMPGVGSALAFADFDRVDFSLRGASVVGIAIPEPTDAIGVAHFKLDGAGAAIDSMRARILAQSGEPQPAEP
jgi:hypothetical protein